MERILVTGGAGFIGAHVVELLRNQGHSVAVVDNLSNACSSRTSIANEFYKINIMSDVIEDVFEKFKPNYVVHLAAQTKVSLSVENPLGDAESNILGTVRIMDCCKKWGIKKVIYASTAAVYGSPLTFPTDETMPVISMSPYAVSKHTGENYLRLYYQLYGINYIVLRFSNVYGPGQTINNESSVIPNFIISLLEQKKPIIFGDGNQTRDFIYVKDVAKAISISLFNGNADVYNVGTGKETSINKILSEISRITGHAFEIEYCLKKRGDILRSCLSNSKFFSCVGWEPSTPLEVGLFETINYFRARLVRS